MKNKEVYILFEGYFDHNDNSHYHFFGCFDSLDKAKKEVESKDKKVSEYDFHESINEWYYVDHAYLIHYVWKILKTIIK
jgi:hypothetical protein